LSFNDSLLLLTNRLLIITDMRCLDKTNLDLSATVQKDDNYAE